MHILHDILTLARNGFRTHLFIFEHGCLHRSSKMEVTVETHYFWKVLEDELGHVPISNHIKNILQ